VAQSDVDDATKNAARELATQAGDAYRKGDFEKAQDLYRRAYALIPAPSLSVREGRSLEKLGRLVQAAEAYVRTVRTPMGDNAPDAFRDAVKEASEALAQLRPRIPKLTVSVTGIDRKDPALTVTIDGKPLAKALVGVGAPVNPGEHDVVATVSDGRHAEGKITLEESGTKTLELDVGPPPKGSGVKPAPAASTTPASSKNDAKADTGTSSSQRTWAYVAMGAGVAGVGLGVATGLMATARHSSAEDACPDQKCPPGSSGMDDVDAFRTLRTVSTIGYIVGVVGVGAGATLWLTAPKNDGVAIAPTIGPLSAGVRGRF
jgi:hypothetical protein